MLLSRPALATCKPIQAFSTHDTNPTKKPTRLYKKFYLKIKNSNNRTQVGLLFEEIKSHFKKWAAIFMVTQFLN